MVRRAPLECCTRRSKSDMCTARAVPSVVAAVSGFLPSHGMPRSDLTLERPPGRLVMRCDGYHPTGASSCFDPPPYAPTPCPSVLLLAGQDARGPGVSSRKSNHAPRQLLSPSQNDAHALLRFYVLHRTEVRFVGFFQDVAHGLHVAECFTPSLGGIGTVLGRGVHGASYRH